MRHSLKFILALLMVLICSNAQAAPVSWTDTYSPASNVFMNTGNFFYSYTHNLTDNGFDVGADIITSALLSIDLDDDSDGGLESVLISVSLLQVDTETSFQIDDVDLGVGLAGLVQLNLSGTLTVLLTRLYGDFYFISSTLTASGCTPCAPVPEPGTLVMLGLGMSLLGMAVRSRKSDM